MPDLRPMLHLYHFWVYRTNLPNFRALRVRNLPHCHSLSNTNCSNLPHYTDAIYRITPVFSDTYYAVRLGMWPAQGATIRIYAEATTPDGAILSYTITRPPSFLELDFNRDILFTQDLTDAAYVGPNNVLHMEIVAVVEGQPERRGTATIALIFPRPTTIEEEHEI